MGLSLRCREDLEKNAKRAEWDKEREKRAKKNEENTLEVLGPGEGYQKILWIFTGREKPKPR